MATGRSRRVIANISLSLDGRIKGLGGDYDMGWIVPHAVSDRARDHMVRVTSPATTALMVRKNFEGFRSYWPGVADDRTSHTDPATEIAALRTQTRWRRRQAGTGRTKQKRHRAS